MITSWTCHCGRNNGDGQTHCGGCGEIRQVGSGVEPFTFPDTGQPVRAVEIDGEPWFVAADVCAVLGLGRHQDSTRHLDDDEKGECLVDTPSGAQRMTTVNEPGLYSLVLRSRRPEARAFKRWVTHEVLPAIRRTGSYGAAQQREPSRKELARYWYEAEERAEVEHDARLAAETRAAELEPAAGAWSTLADAHGDYSLREAAQILDRDPRITTGQNRLARTLREMGWTDLTGQPYQRHIDNGRLARRTVTYPHPRTGVDQVTTQLRITAKGLEELRRHLDTGGQLTLIPGGA